MALNSAFSAWGRTGTLRTVVAGMAAKARIGGFGPHTVEYFIKPVEDLVCLTEHVGC